MRKQVHQVALAEARILSCDWDKNGGRLVYDISHLHPEWGELIQTYEVISQDYEGQLIYESSFALYKRGEHIASSFADYPKPLKAELWKIVFAIKRKFFAEVKPDIVTHFIKQEYSAAQRYGLYQKYLALPNYEVVLSSHDFTYFKRPAAEDIR